MTFRDISRQIVILPFLIGCWAPEVVAPTPKKSPAELTGLSDATPSSQRTPKPPSALHRPNTEPSKSNEEISPSIQSFPLKGIAKAGAHLLGHGGGVIMTIEDNRSVEVMEQKDSQFRVLCKNCSPKHPFQAGWMKIEDITISN